jgi:hypothetical protein
MSRKNPGYGVGYLVRGGAEDLGEAEAVDGDVAFHVLGALLEGHAPGGRGLVLRELLEEGVAKVVQAFEAHCANTPCY